MAIVSLHDIPPIEDPQVYLETSFRKARKRVSAVTVRGTSFEKSQKKEFERANTLRDALVAYLDKIAGSWPSFDSLPEFYQQLLENTLDKDRLKKSLARIQESQRVVKHLTKQHIQALHRLEGDSVKPLVTQFIGRVSSVMNKLEKPIAYLQACRLIIRKFPAVDPERFTVAIAGFPNVGKSTLLSKITSATPEIKGYAFTTKGLNVGNFEYKFHQIQCIDTPGTLARDKENTIERLATLTRQYLAHMVVYVFDWTETYPLEDQEKLLGHILDEGLDVVYYLSKTDVLPEKQLEEALSYLSEKTGAEILTEPEQVLTVIKEFFNEW